MALTPSHVFWLFGLSGAGKSTLAGRLIAHLRQRQLPLLALDGDVLRSGLCRDLGFSPADRAENLRRAAEVAHIAAADGLWVVASFITPLEQNRKHIAEIIGRENLSFIFADAPLTVCRERDVKGLYARAQSGNVPLMTGVSSSFEPSTTADLIIHTDAEDVSTSWHQIERFVAGRLPPQSS